MRYPAIALLLIAAALLFSRLDFGWLAHDEGTLALAAQRVMAGDWPHLDFDDPYSGGLALFNALLFTVFGENLVVLRLGLAAVVMLTWIGVAKVMVKTFPWPAVVATCSVATLWSVGMYPTPMPSWYQAFLALAAGAAAVVFIRRGQLWMLAVAGSLAGVSIVFKVTGVYTVAALMLALGGARRGWSRYALVAVPAAAAVVLLATGISWQRAVVLLVPIGLAALASMRLPPSPAVSWRALSVLGATVLAPVLSFLAISASKGALIPVLEGWFGVPQTRYTFATTPPESGLTGIAAILAFVPLVAVFVLKSAQKLLVWGVVLVTAAALLYDWALGIAVFSIGVTLSPLVGGGLLVRRQSVSPEQVLWVSLLSFTALLAFPFSNFVYALYIVPLAAVALLSMATPAAQRCQVDRAVVDRAASATILAAVVFAGVFVVGDARKAIYANAIVVNPPIVTIRLDLERASLEVEQQDGVKYNALIPRLGEVAGEQRIYAGPDLPHVYALAGLRPVAPVIYDFLTSRFVYQDIPALLEEYGSLALVIDRTPAFSDPIPPQVLEILEAMFPQVEYYDDLELRWR
jgi:hypothetical protein